MSLFFLSYGIWSFIIHLFIIHFHHFHALYKSLISKINKFCGRVFNWNVTPLPLLFCGCKIKNKYDLRESTTYTHAHIRTHLVVCVHIHHIPVNVGYSWVHSGTRISGSYRSRQPFAQCPWFYVVIPSCPFGVYGNDDIYRNRNDIYSKQLTCNTITNTSCHDIQPDSSEIRTHK